MANKSQLPQTEPQDALYTKVDIQTSDEIWCVDSGQTKTTTLAMVDVPLQNFF